MTRMMSTAGLVLLTPLLLGFDKPATRGKTAHLHDVCDELLERCASELERDQYPTMLTLAQERLHKCPGPESSFLVGVAKANMIDRLLVTDAERPLVREQALEALRTAVNDVRPQWHTTAVEWLRYLEELPETRAREDSAPQAAATHALASSHRAAPPFEPDTFPWGPVLLGSAGVVTLSVALVTGLVGDGVDAELHRAALACTWPCVFSPASRMQLLRKQSEVSTLYTVTNVLLVAGTASLVSAVIWYTLRPTPSDREVSVLPYVRSDGAGAQLSARF